MTLINPDIDQNEDDQDELTLLPRMGRPGLGGSIPPVALRGISPAAMGQPQADTYLPQRTSRDEAEASRLDRTGSGISQIQHGSPEGGIGIGKPHRVLGGILRGLDIAGSIAAPGIMERIPGTSLHHKELQSEAQGRIGKDIEEQGKEAQAEDLTSQAELRRKQAVVADQPKPKEEEWSVIPGMIGPKGEPVQQEKNSGQIRFAPNLTDVGPLKEGKQTPAHISYDSGIPVSVTDEDGKVYDVNDPKIPPNLKPLVDAANRAHGTHVQEAKDVAVSGQAATAGRQQKTEDFQQQEKGREHVTKIEDAYTDAASKADLIRDAIKQAQSGNKMAGAFQGMLATLGITTMEGVKRINAVELGIPTGAGSLWDRVQGKVGQWTAGQPMDADLQGDLIALADTIQKAAYKKYQTNHQSLVKRYGLTDEEALPEPGGGQQGGGGGEPQRPANVPPGYIFQENGPKGRGWYKPVVQ